MCRRAFPRLRSEAVRTSVQLLDSSHGKNTQRKENGEPITGQRSTGRLKVSVMDDGDKRDKLNRHRTGLRTLERNHRRRPNTEMMCIFPDFAVVLNASSRSKQGWETLTPPDQSDSVSKRHVTCSVAFRSSTVRTTSVCVCVCHPPHPQPPPGLLKGGHRTRVPPGLFSVVMETLNVTVTADPIRTDPSPVRLKGTPSSAGTTVQTPPGL